MSACCAPGRIARSAGAAARRFPFALLSAVVAAVAGAGCVAQPERADLWLRLSASAALGLPLFLRVGLAAEGRKLTGPRVWLLHVALVLIPAAVFWRWEAWTDAGSELRFIHLFATLTVGFLAASYGGRPETPGFWHFNRILFLRLLFGAAYATVILAGLAAALFGFDALFGTGLASMPLRAAIVVFGIVFQTWFFLAGVPRDFDALDRMDRFPAGAWLERYARWFWIAVLPAAGMLFAAVWQRLAQHGVTEPRYLLAALSLWLGGAAAYAIVRRPRGIVWIPRSVAIVGMLTLVGPWYSAYDWARRSQSARLEAALSRHGALRDGLFVPAAGEIPAEDREQIGDIFFYLIELHGARATDRWFEGGTAILLQDREALAGRGRDAALLTGRLLERLGPEDGADTAN